MKRGQRQGGVVGSFMHLDSLLAAVQAVQAEGCDDFDVFSPVPRHELEPIAGKRKSPVRIFTLLGGLSGMAGAFFLTVLTASIWNMVVGGKPIAPIPPFLVPVFELTILFAAIATLVAIFLLGRLPKTPSLGYHPSFSDDRFGLYVRLPPERRLGIKTLLEQQQVEACWLVPGEEEEEQ